MRGCYFQKEYKQYKYVALSLYILIVFYFQISFCSSVLGEFDEVFLLTADGAPEPVKLRIRLCVVCVCMCVCTRVRAHVYICVLCMCICVCCVVCVHVYAWVHTCIHT